MTFWDWMTANTEKLGPGEGLYGTTHFILIGVLALLIVLSCIMFWKVPKFSKWFVFGCAIFMLVSRVFRMIFRVCVGADTIFQALPWHLCHIMCFILSIMIISGKTKHITPFAIFGWFGGVLTFLFGNYYQYNALTFYDVESIILHFMLAIIPLYYIITKQFKYNYKTMTITLIFMLSLVSYAEIGNTIFKTTNFMFIRQNGLPFKIFPGSHIWTYLFLVAIVYALGYAGVAIKYAVQKKKAQKQKPTAEQTAIEEILEN